MRSLLNDKIVDMAIDAEDNKKEIKNHYKKF